MARIVILTGNHLFSNPRVAKEADALCAAGHDVEVLGAWFDRRLALADQHAMQRRPWRYTPVVDVSSGSSNKFWWMRLRRRAAQTCFHRFKLSSRFQLGYGVADLWSAACSRAADMYITHSEQGLWVASQLARRGARIGVDMEDWFSHDLPPEARRARPIAWLEQLEREVLERALYRVTTSAAMSSALAEAYGCPAPDVVYNVFPWSDREAIDNQFKDRRDRSKVSIHWFSQTLGRGRGLEDLLAALPYLREPVEVHLRGNSTAAWPQQFPVDCPPQCRDWVFMHPLVSGDELLSRIAEHDIGFAGEQLYCANKDLTVSNKLFQYMTGGLAVVATATRGQQEALQLAPGAGLTYPVGDARALAGVLNAWLADRALLARAKVAALVAARERFCWERQRGTVVEKVAVALQRKATG